MKTVKHIFQGLVILALCAVALWFRTPRIGEGLPFFYREDEAHHFNRLANMVKSGDLNPHYFHKPSLHFYLRIPAFSAAFIQLVREGHLRSLKEIRTSDPFGVANYAFSASHPGVVKGVRALSVLFSAAVVVLTFTLGFQLSGSLAVASIAGVLTAVSPSLVADSAVIGVDGVMTFFCLAAVCLALHIRRNFSCSGLFWTGLLCGLAISSKYNALPIALLPLVVCLVEGKVKAQTIMIALAAPLMGFLLGSPYILSSLPLFLDQLAYEVWHYGVASHEGHTAEPGLAQAYFYLRWLNQEALGPVAAAFGTAGVILLIARNQRAHATFLLFPALFALLMISQRTNFTRNMLVIIPFVSVISVLAVFYICELLSLPGRFRTIIFAAFALLALFAPPNITSIMWRQRSAALALHDSRLDAAQWLEATRQEMSDVAVSGQLQFPHKVYDLPGVNRVDQSALDPIALGLHGVDAFVVSSDYAPSPENAAFLPMLKEFPGNPRLERIVENPAIKVLGFRVPEEHLFDVAGDKVAVAVFQVVSADAPSSPCAVNSEPPSSTESYCWLGNRASLVKLDAIDKFFPGVESGIVQLTIEAMTPWKEQVVSIMAQGQRSDSQLAHPGEWSNIALQVPLESLRSGTPLRVMLKEVHAPSDWGLSSDPRRLGLAVRRVFVQSP